MEKHNEKSQMSNQVEDLLSEVECLQQDKYSLTLKLDAKSHMVISQENEIDILKNELDILKEEVLDYQKQKDKEDKRNQTVLDEKIELKKLYDEVKLEAKTLQEKANLLQKQIQAEKEKNAAEAAQLKFKLEIAIEKEKNLLCSIKDLEHDVKSRDVKIKGYIAEIKQGKEDLEQMQYQIQNLRSGHLHENHGISIDSELQKNGIDVELEDNVLQNYDTLKKDYVQNKADLDCTKIQLKVLQNIISSNLKDLEEIVDTSSVEILGLRSEVMNMQKVVCRKNAKSKRLRDKLKQNQHNEKQLNLECEQARAKLSEVQMEFQELRKGIKYLLFKSDKMKQDVQNKTDDSESLDGVQQPSTSEKELRRATIDVLEVSDENQSAGQKHNEIEKFSWTDIFTYICLLPRSCCGL